MSAPTPEQAAFDAFQASRAKRHPMMPVTAWTHPAVDDARPDWKAAAQAVLDAATEGSLRACGYTLADVGRFLEAEAAAQPQPAPELAGTPYLDALSDALTRKVTEAAAESARLREALDEIGVMAANAPEDGDSFGVLEEITMRIAAADVPIERAGLPS